MNAYCLQCLRVQIQRTCLKESYTSYLFLKRGERTAWTAFSTRSSSSSKQTDSEEMVYVGTLSTQIRGVKMFSLITSVTGLCGQPLLIEQASKLGSKPLIVAVCGIVGFFTFVTPVLLHLVTKKYVTEIWYNNNTDKYTATTLTIFLREKYIEFTPDDVKVPDIPGMFTYFTVKGVPLFIEPTTFKQTMHYGRIMGYDKPLDLKLRNVCQEDTKKK